MEEAIEFFTRTVHTSWNRFSDVLTFRHMARLGMPVASRIIHDQFVKFTHELHTNPKYDKLFINKKAAIEAWESIGGLAGLAKSMADNQSKNFEKSVDAASLIFAHSVLDGVALDYCKATAMVSPVSWEQFLDKKQVAMQEIRGKTYESLLKTKVEEHLQALDRESLLAKVERLFALCKPPEGYDPIRDYKYDRDRLLALDRNRHTVIHKLNLENPLPGGDEDISFFMSTANYLMAMIAERFDLRIDTNIFMRGAKPNA